MTRRKLAVAAFVACLALTAYGPTTVGTPVPTWPKPGHAEPLALVEKTPPPFPTSVPGYALDTEWRDTIRAFNDGMWSSLDDLPATMNGCNQQRFYIRWRAANPHATVVVTFLSIDGIALGKPVAGTAGFMSSYGCAQPAFSLRASADGSTLTDVVVEVQQWEISV